MRIPAASTAPRAESRTHGPLWRRSWGGCSAAFQRGSAGIQDFGLTELFSESSEPPFDEFPFEEFQQLFPEGRYTFSGTTIDGQQLKSAFRFTHKVPDAPHIVTPADESDVAPDQLVVSWKPATSPEGVKVVAYQVLVVADEPAKGNRYECST